MFGRKKMYKKGMADAAAAYEAFGKKQEAALEKIREEVRSGNKKFEEALASLGEDIHGIYDYLSAKEKEALYHLSTPTDIKDFDDSEKRLLVAVLMQLANDEGELLNDSQKKFIRSVQRYLDIVNPQLAIDLSAVENIDSIEVQKAVLQVCLEFFYLQDGVEISDAQEDFLSYFSVNKKQAEIIEFNVSQLFNLVGTEGIAEKYGFVSDDIEQKVEYNSLEEIEIPFSISASELKCAVSFFRKNFSRFSGEEKQRFYRDVNRLFKYKMNELEEDKALEYLKEYLIPIDGRLDRTIQSISVNYYLQSQRKSFLTSTDDTYVSWHIVSCEEILDRDALKFREDQMLKYYPKHEN